MTPSVPITAADVEDAAVRLAPVIRTTPLERNDRLSQRCGFEVLLKREDLQVVRSYKLRGAYNLIAGLSAAERASGVVCASAGNHAQGVAYSCRALGVRGRIFLPTTTPRQKLERIEVVAAGAVDTILTGGTYDEAMDAAAADAVRTGAVVVPPFDDERTIAGQGTVASEAVAQLGRPPTAMVVPVGGGGLAAGSAAWLQERCPHTHLIGVEPAGAASMGAALAAGRPVVLESMDTFVDGAAVRRVGDITFPLVREGVSAMQSVDEGAVCTEMLDLYQSDGIIAEPAGALATTVLPELGLPSDATVIAVLSGGNNDVSRYADVVERSLIHRGLKHYFLVDFPQEPGALRRFLDEVLGPRDDITLFDYVKKSSRETGPALVGVELARRDDLQALLDRMEASPLHIERVAPGSPLFTLLI